MKIRAMMRSDISQVADIGIAAFSNDELHNYLYPRLHLYPDGFRHWQTIRLRKRLVQCGSQGFVAVTDDDKVTGFAFFVREPGPDSSKDTKAAQWMQDSWFNKCERCLLFWEESYHNFFDRALDRAHLAQWVKTEHEVYGFYDDLRPYWHVSVLAVHPQYQRRGVGTMLLREGQRMARLDDVVLLLESSKAARWLYEKNGFFHLWRGELCGMEDVSMVWHPDVHSLWDNREERQKVLEEFGLLKDKLDFSARGTGYEQLKQKMVALKRDGFER